MLRRHPVVLKENMNRADTKVSVTVEPEFICPSVKHEQSGNVRQPYIQLRIKCESNLKPDSQSYSRNPFCPGARVIDILPF